MACAFCRPEDLCNPSSASALPRIYEAFDPRRAAGAYSMITVDCPEISNRLRQRMFLQAIMSSFRTM